MNRSILSVAVLSAVLGVAIQAQSSYSLTALSSFGGGDGWLAPAEGGLSYLTAANSEQRGLAYNPATGHLLLVSRSGGLSLKVLDGASGASVGDLAQGTGVIAGGTLTANMIGAAGDGAIYLSNLSNPVNGTTAFTVYRWANEAATPTVAYSSTSVTAGRLGDTLDVFGSGSSTLLVAGESNNAGTGARNGYVVLSTVDGVSYSGTQVAFAGTPPNAGDHRFGLTFVDQNTVIGTQGGNWRLSDFAGGTGTLLDSSATTSATERPLDYAVVGGVPVLATLDSASALVRIYNLTDPNNPVLVASGNNTVAPVAGNGTGQVKFGEISGNSATLYALGANVGIQAFTFTVVPEPEEYAAMAAAGLVAFGVWRRLRR